MRISLLLICFVCLTSYSQEVCISVFSKDDSAFIPNAEIFNDNHVFNTSKNGKICFNQSSNQIIVTKEGYFTQSLIIANKKNITIYLTPLNIKLKEFILKDKEQQHVISPLFLRKIEDMFLYHARKTEKIKVEQSNANLANNNSRQLYKQISGLNYFETNSSGLGTEIGVRGLSPERSSNLNIRQNGYDISADALGYPDAYYTPPSDAIKTIETVRGAGALQYGTQFGGMINYRIKTAPDSIGLFIKSKQTIGSYNFFNSYNEISRRDKKWNAFGFVQYKKGDDWKVNSNFSSINAFIQSEFQITEKLLLNAEYTYFSYLSQQPGGLTDAMFNDDPTQSIRERNWFAVNWNLPSLTVKYKLNTHTEIASKFFSLFANRKAVGFLGNITRVDPETNRDLLIDYYKNIGNETKFLKRYLFKGNQSLFITGVRAFLGNTIKKQGETNNNSDAYFQYNNPNLLEGSDYTFPNLNLGLYAENVLYLSKKLSFIFGFRQEYIQTNAIGYYRIINRDLAQNIIFDTAIHESKKNARSVLLMSTGVSYEPNNKIQMYGNFSQNYRAINFNDLRVVNNNFRVDSNLQDEKGFNADIGIRGYFNNFISFDLTAYYLYYNNRIGFLLKTDPQLFNTYRFRTNISKSRNIGIESILTIDLLKIFNPNPKNSNLGVKYWVNTSITDGVYLFSQEPAINGNRVELIPNFIFKTGLEAKFRLLKFYVQYSYIGDQYTDATNAEFTSNAISGLIPSYSVFDAGISTSFKFITASLNIDNLLNHTYFTKRAAGYPGPGIIAAPPRMYYFTIGIRF